MMELNTYQKSLIAKYQQPMTNDIKTAADRIVEKYKPLTWGESGSSRETISATDAAILEVEACIELLNRFGHLNSTLLDIKDNYQSILTELKSRIV